MPVSEPTDLVVRLEDCRSPRRVFARGDGRPLELEIGCGKGKFLLAAARKWPERDFLAVDHAPGLVRKVAARAARQGLTNVRLCTGDARELLRDELPPASLARVHVYCPDPWPKRRHAKHRLLTADFADWLAARLRPRGELLFTTDHDPYFRQVVATFAAHPAFVRVTPEESFREIPAGGFDAIFAEEAIPVFKSTWETVVDGGRAATAEP